MENLKRVYITSDEFKRLAHSKIGEGNDAIVYRGKNGKVYKIFKTHDKEINMNSDVRIYSPGNSSKYHKREGRISYIDKYGVVIYYKDAFDKVIDRQKLIKLTYLPESSLYVDGKFVGEVLKGIKGIDLHYAWFLLSRKSKIKILKSILSKVHELTDSYIYPTDLANSPLAGKHSNIKVDFRLNPQIIDLDGNSTCYREEVNHILLNETYGGLNVLFLELLLGPELFEDIDNVDVKRLRNILMNSNIDEETAIRLSDFEGTYDDLNKLILAVSKHK